MSKTQSQLLLAGFTAVFAGYFLVWLPGPAAGLRLIGVELGEWVKFLGVGAGRNWFYGPPITLGLMMTVPTAGWSNGRWQTWVMRGLGLAVSLLAFPAIEDISGPAWPDYVGRVVLIGVVVIMGMLASFLAWKRPLQRAVWWVLALLGMVGTIGPTWYYLIVRPIVSHVLGLPVGIGPGVWLNGAGHLLVTAVALQKMRMEGGG